MRNALVAASLFCVASLATAQSGYEEKYYLVLFSADGSPAVPRLSHSFATFAKTRISDEEDRTSIFTISWLPASLNVKFRFSPEAGANLDLAPTLDYMKKVGGRVHAWGPYEINKVLYDRAAAQFKRLQEGRQLYKMVDLRMKYRPYAANNCIHSLTDIAPSGLVFTGFSYGIGVGPTIAEHFRPWMVGSGEDCEVLAQKLGLRDGYVVFQKTPTVGGN